MASRLARSTALASRTRTAPARSIRTRLPACSMSGIPSLRSSERIARCTVATLTPSSPAVLPKCSVRAKATNISRSAKVISRPEMSSIAAERLLEIGDQIIGVLDAQRDAGEALADRVTPACAPVHRGVNAAEAGRGDQQDAVLHQRVHRRGVLQFH